MVLIDRSSLIFYISRNVNSDLNAVISVNTVLKCTWYIPKFKLGITEYNASECLSVIALLSYTESKRSTFLGHPVQWYMYLYFV